MNEILFIFKINYKKIECNITFNFFVNIYFSIIFIKYNNTNVKYLTEIINFFLLKTYKNLKEKNTII
jgi:hypothetical protein